MMALAKPRRWTCTVRKAGGGALRRRLSKLSYAGWLPHDRGFVLGLPHMGTFRSRENSITHE
jgi:hypothetical protein